MCGIAGIMGGAEAPTVSFRELRQMLAMLSHRGPDGYGLYRDQRVGLAHSRLQHYRSRRRSPATEQP